MMPKRRHVPSASERKCYQNDIKLYRNANKARVRYVPDNSEWQ